MPQITIRNTYELCRAYTTYILLHLYIKTSLGEVWGRRSSRLLWRHMVNICSGNADMLQIFKRGIVLQCFKYLCMRLKVYYTLQEQVFHTSLDWIGLDLFNDDTGLSGHISRPTQVNVSRSCFNSLNKLLLLNYIVQVWGLVEVNCVISDRRISLLAGIPLCMSWELSRRGYSTSQLWSIR